MWTFPILFAAVWLVLMPIGIALCGVISLFVRKSYFDFPTAADLRRHDGQYYTGGSE